MSPERQRPSLSIAERREFEESCRGYRERGMDLEAHLDEWAEEKKSKERLRRAGIDYPKMGTLEEKWAAMKVAHRSLIDGTREQVRRLH